MADKLVREEKEDLTLKDKINQLERSQDSPDIKLFDYIRNVIDDRNALVN